MSGLLMVRRIIAPLVKATLFFSDFTAANGSAPPAAFTPYLLSSGAVIDIQNNRLRLAGSGSSYTDIGRLFLDKFANGAPPQGKGDWDITVDVASSSASNGGNVIFVIRHGESNGGYYEAPYNGYLLVVTTGGYSIAKIDNNTNTQLSPNLPLIQSVAGVLNRYRWRVVGSTLSVKSWAPGASEPAAWAWSGTDTDQGGGAVLYIAGANGTSSYVEYTVDNLKITAP